MKLTRFLSAVLLVCTLSVTQRISAQERTGQGSQREQPQGQPHGSQSQQHSERPQQRGGQEQGVGGGHIPQHGPPPVRTPPAQPQQGQRTERQGQQGQQRRAYQDQPGHPEAPHVHAQNDRWVGARHWEERSSLPSRSSLGAWTLYRRDWTPAHLASPRRRSRPFRCGRIFFSGCAV